MKTLEPSTSAKINNFRVIAGVLLIAAGGVLFLDRYLKTGWLSLFILPAVGGFFYVWGVRARHLGLIIAGGLLGGFGLGGVVAWGPAVQLGAGAVALAGDAHSVLSQIGALLLFTGLAWVVIVITSILLFPHPAWWALIPGGIMTGLGYCFLYTSLHWTDFVLAAALGTGIPLLIWGLVSRLIGLIIPGCLLIGAGAGVYLGWRGPYQGNALAQTGVMLASFAFGWGMISLFGRWIGKKSIWWPMIPGGILLMVGSGLYIGGDPTRAVGFISNTGSIALMIFGLYLLLMRKGIHH